MQIGSKHTQNVRWPLLMVRGVNLTRSARPSSKPETLMPQRKLKTCAPKLSVPRVQTSCKLQSSGLSCRGGARLPGWTLSQLALASFTKRFLLWPDTC